MLRVASDAQTIHFSLWRAQCQHSELLTLRIGITHPVRDTIHASIAQAKRTLRPPLD
jgi:hypothetical protein